MRVILIIVAVVMKVLGKVIGMNQWHLNVPYRMLGTCTKISPLFGNTADIGSISILGNFVHLYVRNGVFPTAIIDNRRCVRHDRNQEEKDRPCEKHLCHEKRRKKNKVR